MTTNPAKQTTSYLFDNAGTQVPDRFAALAAMYDPSSFRHLAAIGVRAGWHCLDIGAGGGSVARWLAERVAPGGSVLATDIDTRYLEHLAHPGVELRRHDIATEPLPESSFDLIHTRLVLNHLPARDVALAKMVAALRPGGWLLLEEFDTESMPTDPALNPAERRLTMETLQRRLLTARGADLYLGRTLAGRLEKLGLTDVQAEGAVTFWRGGSPAAQLRRANFEQIRQAALATGEVTEAAIDADLAATDDPAVVNLSPVMWSVRGQRPGA